MVLVTDGIRALAVFIYDDIQWGEEAQIGFNAGDGLTSFVLSEALSNQTLNIAEHTNIGQLGVFLFDMDSMLLSLVYITYMV